MIKKSIIFGLVISLVIVSISGCLELLKFHYIVHFYLCNDYVNITLYMTLTIDGEETISEEVLPGSEGIIGHTIIDKRLSRGDHDLEVKVHETNQTGIKTVKIDKELWILIIPYEEITFDIMDDQPMFI